MKKQIMLSSLVLLMAGLLAGCGSKSASSRKTISLMQSSDLLSLDTSNHADLTEFNVLVNSMEGLYRTNKANNPSVAMATNIAKPTNHGKTYTFHLRKNARWSNGDPVTATDFVDAWERSVSPKAQSGYNYIFSGIKNADQISDGKKSSKTLGVKALGKHTFQVQLEHPMPYFDRMMILPAFYPQDHKLVQKYGKAYGTKSKNMAYNGAFKVTGWNGTNDQWTLKRNIHYYDQKAIHLNEIRMQVIKDANTAHDLFSQNKLDDATITGVTAKGLQKNKDLIHTSKAGTYYIQLNTRKNRALRNSNLRQAISLVIDRNKLTKDILADGSTPADTYTATHLAIDPTTGKDFAAETTPTDSYDIPRAKELWGEGLKEIHQKGDLKLSLDGDDQTITKNVSQYIQSAIQTNLPGAKVSIKSLPDKGVLQNQTDGSFDLMQTFWLADYADPSNFLGIMKSSNPQNYGKYSNASFDGYLNEAASKSANNQKIYWENMRNAEKTLNRTTAVIPLYHMVESHLINPSLKGVLRHPVGEDDYTRAYLK